MTATDPLAKARALAADEAGKYGPGEQYGVSMGWTPATIEAPGGMKVLPNWWLLITAVSPVPGEDGPLYHFAPAGAPFPREPDLRAEVRRGIDALRDLARAKAAEMARTNGD